MWQRATEQTLGEVLAQTAARLPDSPALLSEARTLSWSELDREVNRVANLFVDQGVAAGDVIGFVLDKRPEVVIGFLACARIGAVMAPVNFKLHPRQVQDQFATSSVTWAITQHSHRGVVEATGLSLDRVFWVGESAPDRVRLYDDNTQQPDSEPTAEVHNDTVCYYNYTSGTTGRPKGAATTHANILHNAVATIDGLGFGSDDVFLGMFSVFAHPHELFHRSIVTGAPFAILDSLSPRMIAQAIERFQITWMMAVPSFYEMLLDHKALGAGKDGFDLSSLRILESGGAYVGPDMLRRMEDAFDATFLPVWGCTEATGVGLAMPVDGERRPGATGKAVPGYQVQVMSEDGSLAPPGQVGELWIRGPAVASEYVAQPDETAAQFSGGWYHTHDLVWQDVDGFVHFAGRMSEMLKIGGIRVYPLEIEQVVLEHPEVKGAVVVRTTERLRGEVARCVIETIPGSTLDRRSLQAWCRENLASYKVPRIVEFWKTIPTLPNGKVDKKAVLNSDPDPARDER